MVQCPKVSVLMAVYNAEPYLSRSIESLLGQTYENIEIICVNDGSSDDSLAILRHYAARDHRIVVIDQQNKGKASIVRNVALGHVTGDYIFIQDSDDYLSLDCIEKAVNSAVTNSADCSIPDLTMFENKTEKILNTYIGLYGDRNVIISGEDAFVLSLNWQIGGICLWKRELIIKFGFEESGMNGDEYSTRLFLLNSNKVCFSSGSYYYRKHEASTTNKISSKLLDVYCISFKIIQLIKDNQFPELVLNKYKLEVLKDLVFRQAKFSEKKNQLAVHEQQVGQTMLKDAFEKMIEITAFNQVKKVGSLSDKILLFLFFPKYNRFVFMSNLFANIRFFAKPIAKIILAR